MAINFRDSYKVDTNKSNVEKAYEYQMALKNDKEYETRVDNTFMQIVALFKKIYPGVKIEAPRGREKSNKSLRCKIENLEIERLCKIYAKEGLSQEEQVELYNDILKSMNGEEEENTYKICFEPLKNLKSIDAIMKNEDIPEKTKTALLRIVKIRLLEQEKTLAREILLLKLDKKYGKGAAERTRQLKNDILRWDSIERINSEEKIKKLHNPEEFLKVKDLRGIKIVIGYVPEDVKTNNEMLKRYLKIRENASPNDQAIIGDICSLELAKEFAHNLISSQKTLEKLGIQVLPEGYKHKEKQNGYIAEHIKLAYTDKPEYTFEFQIHSTYREDLSMANGPADHALRICAYQPFLGRQISPGSHPARGRRLQLR